MYVYIYIYMYICMYPSIYNCSILAGSLTKCEEPFQYSKEHQGNACMHTHTHTYIHIHIIYIYIYKYIVKAIYCIYIHIFMIIEKIFRNMFK